MCYKENKFLFFGAIENGLLQKFVIFNMITDCFLVEKWRTLEHAGKHVCKNLIARLVVVLAFVKLLKNEESFVKSFSHCLQNVLIKTVNAYFGNF